MGKIYGNKVPSVTVRFSDDSYKVWKKWTEKKLINELTKLLLEKEKKNGRANGSVSIVYAKDPDGDYKTQFSFHSLADCLIKIQPSIEPELLKWFYETDS